MGVNVRQQKRDGAWYLDVYHQGQRAAQKCASEEEAEFIASSLRLAIASGQFDIGEMKRRHDTAPEDHEPEVTLRDYYEKTLRPRWEGSLSRNTQRSFDSSFRVHILPALGHLGLSGLTRACNKKFAADLRKKNVATTKEELTVEGQPPPQRERRLLSRETIRNIFAALRAGLSEAFDDELIPANTAFRLGKYYKEAPDFREEIDPFTAEEVPILLETVQANYGFENYVLLLTLFHCGLRPGEASGLYWLDLDVKNKTLLIRRQFTRGKKGKPKTRKKRAVDISTVLLSELQALKKQRQAEYLAKGKNEIPDLIFLGPGQIVWEEGKPVDRKERNHVDMDNFRNRVFWKACDKAKIRRRRLHETRHTFASLLLSNGESLKYVSAQMGHASIRMTADVYGHLEIGSNRAAVDRLPSLQSAVQSQVSRS